MWVKLGKVASKVRFVCACINNGTSGHQLLAYQPSNEAHQQNLGRWLWAEHHRVYDDVELGSVVSRGPTVAVGPAFGKSNEKKRTQREKKHTRTVTTTSPPAPPNLAPV